MKDRRVSVKAAIVSVLLLMSTVFGVTDEEIAKMRQAMPSQPVVQPAQPRTMLVFSRCDGYKHESVPYWAKALDVMSEKTGAFKVVHSEDMSVFTKESLKTFDVICLNNTTKLTPDKAQQQAIMDFVQSGKGIVGIHAATDNFYQWPEGMQMMGGIFSGHPWTAGGTWAVKLDDPTHPLMKSFKGQNFKINDEIYRTASPTYSRKNQRVLMSLDMSDETTRTAKGVMDDDMDTGISWVKPVGAGRLFYCSLGHNTHLTWNTTVLEHYLAGIQYAAGDFKIDDTPLGEPLDTAKLDSLVQGVSRYDWASSRRDVAGLEAFVRSHEDDAKVLAQIEEGLLKALASDATLAGKDIFCRQLAIIGTDKSVPVLTVMLADPQTANLARYALEKIPGAAVEQALVNAAQAGSNEDIRIGIVTTLGVRKSQTVPALSKTLLGDKTGIDGPLAVAIVQALGAVGTQEAAVQLNALGSQLTGESMACRADALLMCADAMLKSGQAVPAVLVYQGLYQSKASSIIKAAALCGLVKADPEKADSLIKPAIVGDDAIIQAAAIQSLVWVKDHSGLLKSAAASAMKLPTSAQIHLMTVMADASESIAAALAVNMLDSQDEAVRIAAFRTLEKTGDETVVDLLAAKITQAQDRTEQQAGRDALCRMSGREIDRAIVHKVAGYKTAALDEDTVVELIKATVGRNTAEAPEVLFRAAGGDSKKISDEAIRALQTLAGPEYMEEFVNLLISQPTGNVQKALVVAAEKIVDPGNRAALLLDMYPTVSEQPEVQIAMLSVMGKLGDPHSAALLKKEFASTDVKISQAAFRSMTEWPGHDFVDEMKTLTQQAADAKTQILAFRAYVRMLDASATDANRSQVLDALIEACAMAPRADEQKAVIGVLGNYGSMKALTFVQDKAKDPALKAEATVALLQICEKVALRNPQAVKPIVTELQTTGHTDSMKKTAADILARIKDLDSFIADWQVSEVYRSEGKQGEQLFDLAFAPEKDINSGSWKNAQSLFSPANGMFDLSKLSGGSHQVTYMKTLLTAETAQPAMMKIGSDDGVKVWLNGQLVHAKNVGRPINAGDDTVNVSLVKGQNTVLVKVIQITGGWGFCMQLTDAEGNPAPGVSVDAGNRF